MVQRFEVVLVKKIINKILLSIATGLIVIFPLYCIWIYCWGEFKVTKDIVFVNTAGSITAVWNDITESGYSGFELVKYKKIQGRVFVAQIECIPEEMESYKNMLLKDIDINDNKKYKVRIWINVNEDKQYYITNRERIERLMEAHCKSGYLYIDLVSGEMIPGLSEDGMYRVLKEKHGITEEIKFRKNNLFSYERVFDFVFLPTTTEVCLG